VDKATSSVCKYKNKKDKARRDGKSNTMSEKIPSLLVLFFLFLYLQTDDVALSTKYIYVFN